MRSRLNQPNASMQCRPIYHSASRACSGDHVEARATPTDLHFGQGDCPGSRAHPATLLVPVAEGGDEAFYVDHRSSAGVVIHRASPEIQDANRLLKTHIQWGRHGVSFSPSSAPGLIIPSAITRGTVREEQCMTDGGSAAETRTMKAAWRSETY